VSVAPSCFNMFLRKVAPRRQSSVYCDDPEIVLRLINFESARKNISMSQDLRKTKKYRILPWVRRGRRR